MRSGVERGKWELLRRRWSPLTSAATSNRTRSPSALSPQRAGQRQPWGRAETQSQYIPDCRAWRPDWARQRSTRPSGPLDPSADRGTRQSTRQQAVETPRRTDRYKRACLLDWRKPWPVEWRASPHSYPLKSRPDEWRSPFCCRTGSNLPQIAPSAGPELTVTEARIPVPSGYAVRVIVVSI